MADSAAQALKDLQTSLQNVDKNLASQTQALKGYIDNIKTMGLDVNYILDVISKKISGTHAEKFRILTEFVDDKGKPINPKKLIEDLSQFASGQINSPKLTLGQAQIDKSKIQEYMALLKEYQKLWNMTPEKLNKTLMLPIDKVLVGGSNSQASKEWKDQTKLSNEAKKAAAEAQDGYIKQTQAAQQLTKTLEELRAKRAELESLPVTGIGKAGESFKSETTKANALKKVDAEIVKTEKDFNAATVAAQGFEAKLIAIGQGKRVSNMKKALGIDVVEPEMQKIPTVFDRVIEQINQRAAQNKDKLTKQLVDANGIKNEAENAFKSLRLQMPPLTRKSWQELINIQNGPLGMSTLFAQNAMSQKMGWDVKSIEAMRSYKDALQSIINLQDKLTQSQRSYNANVSAVEGVTRRFNENEQAIARVRDRWEELNVKKQAGLVSQKDFDTQTQKILDEYDRLIAKKKEFEIGDLGQLSSQRKQFQERYKELLKEKDAAEKARIARGLASTDPNMNAAVNKQVQYQRQLIALRKEYNALNNNQNRTQEENAILEQTKNKIKEIIGLSQQLNKEQQGSHGLAKQITDYDRIKQKIHDANKATKEHKASLESLLPTLQRLASAFGVAFSVQGLVQFGKKLIETRGQFELQQTAMRSILQNKQLADEIWDKTMQQALQSPFTAMQLTKYTKQLAAYRIETNKLFDTTKMLADVSAGLGVDMQRLILAYGQVKAANFLRSSEIRQFTEAGVNILGELAQYFTETRNQAYTTSQVMDMVQKRMVKFEDVEAIFKRMTSVGGTFYDMQFVQSQTVKGQINKLHDAYEQMLNTIGKANQGTIRNFVGLLNNIVQNWREWKTAIDMIAWPLIISSIYKFGRGLFYANAAIIATNRNVNILTRSGAKLQLMLSSLLKTLTANPWMALAAAVGTAAVAIHNHMNAVRAYRAEILEQNTRLFETQEKLEGYKKAVEENNDAIKSGKLVQEEANAKKKENRDILTKLNSEYPELVKGVKQETDGTVNLTKAVKDYNDELERQMTLKNFLSFGGDWFNDTYGENLQEYAADLSKIKGELISIKATASSIMTYMHLNGGENSPLYKVAESLKNLDISDVEVAAKKYKEIIESILVLQNRGDVDVMGLSDEAKKFGFDKLLPITEFEHDKKLSLKAFDAVKDIFLSYFTDAVSSVDDYSKEITEKYGDNVLAFVADNIDLIKTGIEEGNADVVHTIGNTLEQNGNATTAEAKKWYNDLLNAYITFHDENVNIASLEAQLSAERAKKVKNQDIALIQSIEKEINNLKATVNDPKNQIDFFAKPTSGSNNGNKNEDGKKSKNYKSISSLISLLKEMNSEYDKLSKSAYGFAKSNEKVKESFKDAFNEVFKFAGIDINQVDTTSKASTANAMKLVLDTLDNKKLWGKFGKDGGEKARQEFLKAFGQMKAEVDIQIAEQSRADFGRQMEESFGNYELTLELQKLNLPKGLASEMWGIEETDLQDLRTRLTEMYDGLRDETGKLSTDAFKDYEKFLNKIDDLERKQQRERLKDYAKYLETQYSDRVKIEMEYIQKLSRLEAETAIPEAQKSAIREGLRKEFDEKSRKQDWEDFKGSEFYVEMMEDLEKQGTASLEVMRKKLLEMRSNAENLLPRALKEVVNALEKIDEIESKRTQPLKRVRDAQRALDGVNMKEVYEKLSINQEQLALNEEEEHSMERAIMLIQKRNELEEQGYTIEEARVRLSQANQARGFAQSVLDSFKSDGTKESQDNLATMEQVLNSAKADVEKWQEIVNILSGKAIINEQAKGNKYTTLDLGELQERRKNLKQSIKDLEGVIGKEEELVKLNKELNDAWDATYEVIKNWASSVQGVFDGVMDNVDYFSDSTYGMVTAWKEFGDTSVLALNDLVSGIQAYRNANAEAEKNNEATGLFTANGLKLALVVLGVLMKIVQAIAKQHDAALDKQIQIQQERIDALRDAYARLEKQIDRTLSTMDYIGTYNQQVQNLKEQITALEEQRRAEDAKKNTDKDRINEYNNAIQDAEDQLEELRQKQIETFGGIGEDNYRSAAEEFVEAWKEAFVETGDGLQGLQDHFDEFLSEWFVKQATMRGAAKMLEPVFKQIDDAVSYDSPGNYNVTMEELQGITDGFNNMAPAMAEFLKNLYGMFGIGEEGGLSGLAAGIQGMTEEQANILEAYWNSVRQMTASIDSNVASIALILGAGGVNTNPMLTHLQTIADNTSYIQSIYELLTPLQTNGGNGRGFRTYQM